MKNLLVLFIVILSIRATYSQEKEKSFFFDIQEYVTEEIPRILSTNDSLYKTITLNGKTESHAYPITDSLLKKELELLQSANINKPALWEKYRVDSVYRIDPSTFEEWLIVSYDAIDSSMHVRHMQLIFFLAEGEWLTPQLEKIHIQQQVKNVINAWERNMVYTPHVSLSVSGWRKTLFQSKQEYSYFLEYREE